MLVLPPRDRATLLMMIHREETTPRALEEKRPGVLRAMRFSERHYRHWCHVRGKEPDLPEVYGDPMAVVEGVACEPQSTPPPTTKANGDVDWPALVAEGESKGKGELRPWLKERGINPVDYYRARKEVRAQEAA